MTGDNAFCSYNHNNTVPHILKYKINFVSMKMNKKQTRYSILEHSNCMLKLVALIMRHPVCKHEHGGSVGCFCGWSVLNNWLVWRMRPSLPSGGEDKYPHLLLVLSQLCLVLIETSIHQATSTVIFFVPAKETYLV